MLATEDVKEMQDSPAACVVKIICLCSLILWKLLYIATAA